MCNYFIPPIIHPSASSFHPSPLYLFMLWFLNSSVIRISKISIPFHVNTLAFVPGSYRCPLFGKMRYFYVLRFAWWTFWSWYIMWKRHLSPRNRIVRIKVVEQEVLEQELKKNIYIFFFKWRKDIETFFISLVETKTEFQPAIFASGRPVPQWM